MLPHLTPNDPNGVLAALPSAHHLNAYPIMIPGSSAAKGTRGHTRRRASPRARRTGCPCAFCWWQPVRLDSPSSAQAAPEETPRPVGPHEEREQPRTAASSQAPGHPFIAARVSFSGRMPSASIVPPASWPCCPSTFRLSRSPQPASRRNSRGHPSPLPHRPAAFCGSTATPRPTPAKRRAILFRQQTYPITNQDPHTQRLLDPTYALRIKQQGVRFAHVHLLHTPGAFGPSRGRLWPFCCGARLARVVRLQKEGWGLQPHTPLFAREACRRRNPPKRRSPSPTDIPHANGLSRRQASIPPLSAPQPSDARSAQA